MRSFIDEGRLKEDALVWCQGMKDWAHTADVEPFRSHFAVPQARPAERPTPSARPTITSKRHGGGRKIAAVGALVVVVIIAGLGVWWIYPQLTQPTDQQPAQQPSTSPTFKELGLEAEGALDYVVDGDTIRISQIQTNQYFDNEVGSTEYVRFARINAPEEGDTGYTAAGNFVRQLITDGGNRVYLDIDNIAVSKTGRPFRDKTPSERLVAVVYVYINNKLVNVNAEVLIWGQANYSTYNWLKYTSIASEFNHQDWLESGYPYVR
jgi:endonuclease YncB( thermonuclease family)